MSSKAAPRYAYLIIYSQSIPPQTLAVPRLPRCEMLKLNFRTLRFRLTSLVVVLCVVSVAHVAFSCLNLVEHRMKKVLGDEEYALVSTAANFVSRDVEAKRTLLRSVAEQLTNSQTSAGSMQKSLEQNQTLSNEFYNVVMFSDTGELIANMQRQEDVGGFAALYEEFFTKTVEQRRSMISRPFRSPFLGEPVVLVTQPVVNSDGHVAFVLAGGIDLRAPQLLKQLEAVKPGKTGYYFIIDAGGTIIQHPKPNRILANVFDEPGGPTPVTAAALKGFEGWREGVAKDGRTALIAYRKIEGTNWLMGAVYPTAEAFSALSEARVSAWVSTAIVAALAGLTGLAITRQILVPLSQLRRQVDRIADGRAEIEVLDVSRTDEIGALSRAFFALSQQREAAEAKLANLALTDPLTGLGNRRQFAKTMSISIARAERNQQSVALAYLDIDNFKSINDVFGHGIGDIVLVEFAKRLLAAVRVSDTVARLAGDEFVVMFDTLTDASGAADFAQRILDSVRLPFVLEGHALNVTTSVGIAFHQGGHITSDELVKSADDALYKAKRSGRDTYALTSTLGEAFIEQ